MTSTRKARVKDGPPLADATIPTLLSVHQAAAWLGMSRRTLYDWMNRGLIAYHVLPSGRRRFIPSELLSAPIVRSHVAESTAAASSTASPVAEEGSANGRVQ